ncbi:hypothetical protein GOV05_00910 [Candidatus Woesearchaeota archaeon]|nr:hypothetical protein [Candidatus Woesearchaeota archaeon]
MVAWKLTQKLVIILLFLTIIITLNTQTINSIHGVGADYTIFIADITPLGEKNATNNPDYEAQLSLTPTPTGKGSDQLVQTTVFLGYIHVANIDYPPNITIATLYETATSQIIDTNNYLNIGDDFTLNATVVEEDIENTSVTFYNSTGGILWSGLLNRIGNIDYTLTRTTNNAWAGLVNYTILALDDTGQTDTYNASFVADLISYINLVLEDQVIEVGNQFNMSGNAQTYYLNLSGETYDVYFNNSYNQTGVHQANNYFYFNLPAPTTSGNYTLRINTSKYNIDNQVVTWVYADKRPYITNLNISPQPATRNDDLNASWVFNDADPSDPEITYYEWYVNGALNTSGQTSNNYVTFTKDAYNRFDNVTIKVTPYDSYLFGPSVNLTIQIVNAPPILTGINITPSAFKYYANVTITSTDAYDRDGDAFEMMCGDAPTTNNICNSTIGTTNRTCTFNNTFWNDDSDRNIYCRLYDSYNYSTSQSFLVIVDNTPPNITLTSPPSFWVEEYRYTTNFKYVVSDNHSIQNCSVIINNTINTTEYNPTRDVNQTISVAFRNNTYSWSIGCFDIAGNYNETGTNTLIVNVSEGISIQSLGIPGVEGDTQITTNKNVLLIVTTTPSAYQCRYSNDAASWTVWQGCANTKAWQLTDGFGVKTVYAQINHSGLDAGVITDASASIIYSETGEGLGTDTPASFNVYDEGDYTNSDNNLTFSWQDASDEQTKKLGLAITYFYRVYDETTTSYVNNSWAYNGNSREVTITNLSLIENHEYKVEVRARNPSDLNRTAWSDGIITDFTPPVIPSATSSPQPNTWTNTGVININWSGNDNISGVKGYSYVIDESPLTTPDDAVDTTNTTITIIEEEGKYYAHIKAVDNAENNGATTHQGFLGVDKTPPTPPLPYNVALYVDAGVYNATWKASSDALSGVDYYIIRLYDEYNLLINTTNTTNTYYEFTSLLIGNYNVEIISVDKASNNASSAQISLTPLEILTVSPNSTNTKQETIIRATTNREATCSENQTTKDFVFTQSEYHETMIKFSNGSKSIEVTCQDAYGYIVSKNIVFIVVSTDPGSINIFLGGPYYYGQKIIFNLTADNLTSIKHSDFEISIDGERINRNDYSIIDKNKGEYTIIMNPVVDRGVYALRIRVGGVEDTETLFMNALSFTVEYAAPISGVVEKSNLAYVENGTTKIGVAASSTKAIIKTNNSWITANRGPEDQSYLFFTTNEISANNKNRLLNREEFLDETAGFGVSQEEYVLRQILNYQSILVRGLGVARGYFNIIIINEGLDENNNTIIRIEKI